MERVQNYVRNLSSEDRKLVTIYTDSYYADINKGVYNKSYNPKLPHGYYVQEVIRKLNNIFANAPPLSKPITVYRGVQLDSPNFKNYKLDLFQSTSLDRDVALDFVNKSNGCCLFEITLVPGTRVLPIWELSLHKKEKEVLLNKDTTIVLNGTSIEDGVYTFMISAMDKAIVVNDSSDLIKAEKKLNKELVIDHVVEYVNNLDFDPEFDDVDFEIRNTYKRITGHEIPDNMFKIIKERLS